MRKYKDVGKRILVLVLSICMIAGVLPAIPAEAADAFPSNGSITLGADANGATATGNDTYTYTGQEVKPAVSETATDGRPPRVLPLHSRS